MKRVQWPARGDRTGDREVPIPMTRETALQLAKAKWGEDAYAVAMTTAPYSPYQVGCPKEYAVGNSWQEACENARLIAKPADRT